MLMVGVTAIASLKVAVMVTRFEPATILLGSVSVKVTVGAVLGFRALRMNSLQLL